MGRHPGEYDWFAPIQGREELLDAFQQGPDYAFTENHHQARRTHQMGPPEDAEEKERARLMAAVDEDPQVRSFMERSPSHHLASHVKARLLEGCQKRGSVPSLVDILREVADGPVRLLVREAAEQLDAAAPPPTRGEEATASLRTDRATLTSRRSRAGRTNQEEALCGSMAMSGTFTTRTIASHWRDTPLWSRGLGWTSPLSGSSACS